MARLTLQSSDRAIPVLGFVVVRTRIDVVLSIFEQVIDDAGQLVSGGHHRFRGAMFGPHTAIKAPQGTVAGVQAWGR